MLPEFRFDNETVAEVNVVKYLGHFISNDLSDDADIKRQIRQTYAQANLILRKFSMCSLEVKLKLFRSYCSCLYTAQLWWNYNKGIINNMYVAFHNSLKVFIGASKC